MTLVLLLGGARSGKSRIALQLAAAVASPVVFIATGEAGDKEMAERIERHRAERPAGWTTIEEPRRLLASVVATPDDTCLVIDCLSLWVANVFETTDVETEAQEAAAAASSRTGKTIAVSNEVGLGVVPATHLGRAYRDVLGRVNSIWAEAADEAFFVVAGRLLRLSDA